MKRFVAFCLLFSLASAAHAGTARVIAEKVNVRARPDLSGAGEVVFQADLGDEYPVKAVSGEWVGIAAPADCDLWTARSFVRADGTVGASRLKMRCGPGANYTVVDILPRNTPLSLREGQDAASDWVKVAPRESATLWIYREYVELADPPAESVLESPGDLETLPVFTAAPTAAEASVETAISSPAPTDDGERENGKAPARKPRKAKKKAAADKAEGAGQVARIAPSVPESGALAEEDVPPPAPADLALIPLEGQGRMTVVEGEIRAAPLLSDVPARYRLVRWEDNKWKVLAHLYGDAAKYRKLQGETMQVTGRAYWVKNASAPVVVPTELVPAAYE